MDTDISKSASDETYHGSSMAMAFASRAPGNGLIHWSLCQHSDRDRCKNAQAHARSLNYQEAFLYGAPHNLQCSFETLNPKTADLI